MRLDLTQEQELMRETVRRFLETESPLSSIRKVAENELGVRTRGAKGQGDMHHNFDSDWWRRASELGWTMLAVAEERGGLSLSGKPVQDLCVVAEEMGRGVAPGPFQTTVVALSALSGCLNSADFHQLYSQFMAGARSVVWAFSEPGSVWEVAQLKTVVTKNASGWQLDGVKAYVEAGCEADYLVVTALDGGLPKQFLLASDSPGVSVTPCKSLDCVRRFAQVRFERAQIPEHNALQFENITAALRYQTCLAVLLQCAETNGAVDRAMEFTMAYMQDRYAFGRAIASYQALKHRLADMYLCLHSCMAITDSAINALDANAADLEMLCAVAKSYVGSKSTEMISDLVQMTGGIAVTWEHDLHLYGRRTALNRALYGTPEYHRFQLQKLIAA